MTPYRKDHWYHNTSEKTMADLKNELSENEFEIVRLYSEMRQFMDAYEENDLQSRIEGMLSMYGEMTELKRINLNLRRKIQDRKMFLQSLEN